MSETALNEALAHHGAGRLDEAERGYRQLLEAEPGHAQALHLLGVVHLQRGDAAGAVERIRQSLRQDPDNADARANLANALQAAGRFRESIAQFEALLASGPQPPAVRANLGNARLQSGDLRGAVREYRAALAKDARLAEAWRNLAQALTALGHVDEAWDAARRASALAPASVPTAMTRGNVLAAMGRCAHAAHLFEQIARAQPTFAPAFSSLGHALREQGALDTARRAYERALELAPDDPQAHHDLALLRQDSGDLDGAAAALRRALELDPRHAASHRLLAGLTRRGRRDAETEALEALAADPSLDDAGRMHAAYALGKTYEDLGEFDAAFAQFARANALRRAAIDYDADADTALFARLQEVFDRAFFEARAAVGVDDATPILIVGMPRSGTTLVEQILASHGAVHGGGELSALAESIGTHLPLARGMDATASVASADAGTWRRIGTDYCRQVRALAPGAAHITDKMPMNFLHLGVLALAVANARVVHCVRDPAATCLSIFKNYLPGRGHDYGHDLIELGRYYNGYARLMAHWRAVLPTPPVEVSYEALVSDQEGQTRALLARLGLDWDARCLDFHTHRRPVATLSAAQVRRPIYDDSVALWRRYGEALSPLLETLSAGPRAPD